jgi:menaquinone-dependent protoporphyrinogen oxidase
MSQQKGISRRRFLIGVGAAGLGLATCGGAGVLAVREPHIEFSQLSCGQEVSGRGKVLVTYVSQFGSTGGVAAAIAQTLCGSGMAADVKQVTQVDNLSDYSAVIVGAPVHSSAWMPEAVEFVKANQDSLSKLPVAYFLTCMTLAVTDRPAELQKIDNVLEMVQRDIPTVTPVGKGKFTGALEYNKMSFIYRMVYQMVTPDNTTGDFRNWAAIHAWTESIGSKLMEEGV